jgi:hypothetical protein
MGKGPSDFWALGGIKRGNSFLGPLGGVRVGLKRLIAVLEGTAIELLRPRLCCARNCLRTLL